MDDRGGLSHDAAPGKNSTSSILGFLSYYSYVHFYVLWEEVETGTLTSN